jgi:hypothetical protein
VPKLIHRPYDPRQPQPVSRQSEHAAGEDRKTACVTNTTTTSTALPSKTPFHA